MITSLFTNTEEKSPKHQTNQNIKTLKFYNLIMFGVITTIIFFGVVLIGRLLFIEDTINLVIPLTLILVAFTATKKITSEQKTINKKNREEKILNKYLKEIDDILLKTIVDSQTDTYKSAINVVRYKTLTVLRRLNNSPQCKAIILLFLYDTQLINNQNNNQNLDLRLCNFAQANLLGTNLLGANLAKANLCQVNLCQANLSKADLSRANLCGADLSGTNLCGADLSGTNLCGADLSGANLCGADLCQADLSGANLYGAYLLGVDLCEANLLGVDLCGAYLLGATNVTNQQIKSANTWEKAVYTGAIYTKANWDNERIRLIAENTQANQNKIQDIRNDTISDLEDGNKPEKN